jgi:hypothetical protein
MEHVFGDWNHCVGYNMPTTTSIWSWWWQAMGTNNKDYNPIPIIIHPIAANYDQCVTRNSSWIGVTWGVWPEIDQIPYNTYVLVQIWTNETTQDNWDCKQ